jgi:GTP-binding protein
VGISTRYGGARLRCAWRCFSHATETTLYCNEKPASRALERGVSRFPCTRTTSTNPCCLSLGLLCFSPAHARCISKKKARLQSVSPLWAIEGVDAVSSLLPHEMSQAMRFFQAPSTLITSSSDATDLPEWNVPELAFAGRSNVGKSSLINAVVGQPGLVRTSKTPGRTQLLHFFSVGGKKGSLPDLALVDMPGYGFANVPKKVEHAFHALVGGYMEQRRGENLKNVFLLIDARRGVTPVDQDFMDFLHDLGVLYQVVFTKADALSPSELTKHVEHARAVAMGVDRLNMHPVIHVTSVKEGFGIKELQHQIVSQSGLLRVPSKQ